jgi:quaternary ammonium compound-resistance protein SugE
MPWIYLLIASVFEIGFATFLRLSENFSKLMPTLAFVISSIFSLYFMGLSLKQIPIGTAYAIWTGIGAFGVALIGYFCFGETLTYWRLFFLGTLICSIIGLKLSY